jgi:hypothetical protein
MVSASHAAGFSVSAADLLAVRAARGPRGAEPAPAWSTADINRDGV